MRIARARLTPFRLPLREPLETGHGRVRARDGVLLQLEADSGAVGCGEAMPLAGFTAETLGNSFEVLEHLARRAVGRTVRELDAALVEAERLAPKAPVARAALDAALHDLAAQASGVPVAALLAERSARPARSRITVSALVVGETPRLAARSARLAVAAGFDTLKLKLGGRELAVDEARVAALRDAVGSEPKLRLDANGAWKEVEAQEAISRLARFAIEFLEQPVASADLDALARLRATAPLPIAADEAIAGQGAALEVLARGAADFLVLKPAALGGLRAARRVAARARRLGVGVVVTSFLDSAIGRAAALHLAAALPDPLPASGLATGELLADDLAPPLAIARGEIALPPHPGLGVAPEPDALLRLAMAEPRELRG